MVSKSIFLCGFMGVGKSTLGQELAKDLERQFVDIDNEVQNREGLSVAEIFNSKGEEYFRKAESKALMNLPEDELQVVALGGGTLLNSHNLQEILQNGVLVYLKGSQEVLLQRLKAGDPKRPLLKTMSMDLIKKFLNEREKNYQKAHIIVDTENKTMQEIIEELKNEVSKI